MSDVQRYFWDDEAGALFADDRGGFILFTDHERAVRNAWLRGLVDSCRSCNDDGYAAALRDRREQILAAPHHDLCAIKRDYPCNCWRGEQLAAIEALGGER